MAPLWGRSRGKHLTGVGLAVDVDLVGGRPGVYFEAVSKSRNSCTALLRCVPLFRSKNGRGSGVTLHVTACPALSRVRAGRRGAFLCFMIFWLPAPSAAPLPLHALSNVATPTCALARIFCYWRALTRARVRGSAYHTRKHAHTRQARISVPQSYSSRIAPTRTHVRTPFHPHSNCLHARTRTCTHARS